MRLLILSFSLLYFQLSFSQIKSIPAFFKKDLQQLVSTKLSEERLNVFIRKYDSVFNPRPWVTVSHSLVSFKKDPWYIDNIDNLFESKNIFQRRLARALIRATGDLSNEPALLRDLQSSNKGDAMESGITLLEMGSDHTTVLFDFLVSHEDFHDAHFVPLFMALRKDSLEQTAYRRIRSENMKAKILAVQIFIVTGWNPRTDSLIRQAIVSWPIELKGWAIYPASVLGCDKLLPVLKPLIDSSLTRHVALQALANSPTRADQAFLRDLAASSDTLTYELLNAFYKSSRMENIQYWIGLLQDKRVGSGYVFFVMDQPKLSNDSLLAPIHKALHNIKQPQILGELLRALRGRKDKQSLDLLIGFLDHANSAVRHWAAQTLEGNEEVRDENILQKIDAGMKE
jgi:hypothetical protein